jgi:hypothetical protein
LLLLLAISSHEEILYLAAGRAVCLCSMQAGREEWDEKANQIRKARVFGSLSQEAGKQTLHCTRYSVVLLSSIITTLSDITADYSSLHTPHLATTHPFSPVQSSPIHKQTQVSSCPIPSYLLIS